jgi:hypothetical protein
MTFASHRERQFMQYLRGEGWIQARLLPASARLVENLEGAGGQEGTRPDVPAVRRRSLIRQEATFPDLPTNR